MELSDYYQLTMRSPDSLNAEERASLVYVQADYAFREAEQHGRGLVRTRANNWVVTAFQLRRVAQSLRRMPRASDDVPRDLLHWVSYQRRTIGNHNGYQVAFLETVPGWTWAPFDDDWERHEADVRAFLAREGRPPRTRAQDASERALAKWVARQRQLNARGELSYERAKTFRGVLATATHI